MLACLSHGATGGDISKCPYYAAKMSSSRQWACLIPPRLFPLVENPSWLPTSTTRCAHEKTESLSVKLTENKSLFYRDMVVRHKADSRDLCGE
ncbi:unnamed protein product [Pleuronectes platessa]|uniref:Uncharacterized protein n=1 Tax=Pleuronectes platessa TaxID=8262 RepID=A0A9N7ZF01_PLEPL|nr:unnamed protein product [Pleuronectes platessa]